MYHLIISLYENYTKLMKIIIKQDCKYRTSRIINPSSFISPLSLCHVSTNNVPLCIVKSALSQYDERIFIFLLLSDNIFYPHSIYIYIFHDAPFNNVLYYSSRILNRKYRIAVDKSVSRGGKEISLKILRHSVKYCPRYRTYAIIHFDVESHCPSFAYLTIIVISVYEYVPRYFIRSDYFYHSPK